MKVITVKQYNYNNSLYLENLANKARVSLRRKSKFVPSANGFRRRHYSNLTGEFRSEELRRGPKYWHGQKPNRFSKIIRTPKEFKKALEKILSGLRNPGDYRIDGPNIWRERFYTARILRNNETEVDAGYVSRVSYPQLAELRLQCLNGSANPKTNGSYVDPLLFVKYHSDRFPAAKSREESFDN